MSERKDGGPAFPTMERDHYTDPLLPRGGMILRDYFAAKAMQALCANPGAAFQANNSTGWGLVNCDLDQLADISYDIADAMLKQRESA